MITLLNFCFLVSDPNIDNVTIKEHGKWGEKNNNNKSDWR
jgi:hypothetical protein